ncbi:glycosyltransferase, partial [Mariniblastus sp.]|nr:glycosyltransferase [Mariniblastus sp.]
KVLWLLLDGFSFLCSRVQWFSRAIMFRFKRFDVAVISSTGLSPSFCCSHVRANKRVHWIRTDLAKIDPRGPAKRNIQRYNHRIDAFVCVSHTAKQSLVDLFPDLNDKTRVIYNIINSEQIRVRAAGAKDPFVAYGNSLKIVTICRLKDHAKGLFRMLSVHRQLRDSGIDFRWFVVGDGPDRERLMQAIVEQEMEKHFILLGRKENPFPYYLFADVSATLSYYEGLCGTVNEAKVLGRPVIATQFSGIDEQITDGVNGLIVENSEQAIFNGMKRILTDESLRKKLANDILPESITDDESKLRAFDQLIAKSQ